jgi:hypothetical protein
MPVASAKTDQFDIQSTSPPMAGALPLKNGGFGMSRRQLDRQATSLTQREEEE